MLDAEVGEQIREYLGKYENATRKHVVFLLIWLGLLRRGGVRAIDTGDLSTDADDPRIRIRHRPDSVTPLKNQRDANRTIGIKPATVETIRDYVEENRHDVIEPPTRPLVTTVSGCLYKQTIQAAAYAVIRPCYVGAECPHGRDPEECTAARDRRSAYECPSSKGPHDVRRGAITHWIESDAPAAAAVSSRCNTAPETHDEHYDQRSERTKQRQRRQYLDRV